jgi:hypothetical protein
VTTPFLYIPTFAPVFNGASVPNGLLYTYEAGTTNPKPTFSDPAGLFANTNPVILDITGAATVRLEPGSYHFVLTDSTGTTVLWDQDFYNAPYLTGADISALFATAPIEASRYFSGDLADDGLGQYTDTTTVTLHGRYSFLAEPQISYRGGDPIYGHAAFADFSNLIGSVNQDHFNSFQAYPIVSYGGTITNLAGFFARGDFSGAGTVTSWYLSEAQPPTGTGNINNLYGYYCADLGTRASGNNYAFFADGNNTKSLFGGPVQLGTPATPAIIQYNWTSGNLELTPRATFKVHVTTAPFLIGGTTEAFAASIDNNAGTGNLVITPRSTFHTIMAGPLLEVSGDIQSGGPVKLKSYTVAGVPAAASYTGAMVYVSNESGGATPAFSDGTNWRRVADRAIIS